MDRLLIIGASSGIGLATVSAALDAGYRVRAFARGAAGINLTHANLELRAGDALSSDDISNAMHDVDAVVQCLGIPFDTRMLFGPVTLFSAATELLIPAMEHAGVQRLVAVTGFGAGDSAASIHPLQRLGFALVFGRAYADKSRQETLIKASGLDWTLVRPGVLTNGSNGPHRVLLEQQQWRNGLISRANVASYIVASIGDSSTVHRAPVLVR